MKPNFFKYIAVACITVVGFAGCDDVEFAETPEESQQVPGIKLSADELATAEALTAFNYDFMGVCDRARDNRNENLLISPLSAQIVLGMIASSADDASATEIAAALGCSNASALNKLNRKILQEISKLDSKTITTLANSVWHESDFDLLPDFSESMKNGYGADVFPCIMKNAADDINLWCAQNTDYNITDLISQNDLKGAVMALLNALYFKCEWTDKFDIDNTRPMPFHGATGENNVDMMMDYRSLRYNRFSNGAVRGVLVELPFGNGSFSLKLMLPDEGCDINSVVDKASELIPSGSLSKANCTIGLPKFKIKGERLELTNAFKNMGINRLFSNAHLNFFVDDAMNNFNFNAVQQSTVEFDENGAVVTSVTAITGDISDIPVAFIFNRPFLFFITEKQTGACLMAGKVMNL